MKTIQFHDWLLHVDMDLTRSTYSAVTNGSADECSCNDCLNYVTNRTNAFPAEIKVLLDELGIDCRKESEVWRMCKDLDGLHRYAGFFHFKGSFEGESCVLQEPNGVTTLKLVNIGSNFSIGFCFDNSLAYFENIENLVQVEFEVRLPWVISEKEYD